jgi:hypothetical protein
MELEKKHIVNGISPMADIFNADPVSDVISLAMYQSGIALFSHKGGTTGKGTIKVQSCTDFSAANPTDLPFYYRKKTTGASDVWGALTLAPSTGVETVPTEDTIYAIQLDADALAGTGRDKVVVKLTETANDPVTGSLVFILEEAKNMQATMHTAIAAAGPST